jgi:tryptophan synthase alpha chain
VSRLSHAFAARRARTGLVPYLTSGYPSLPGTLEMMHGLAARDVLAIELGIPFSDPIADGPEIQRSSEWAVRAGVGVREVLDLVGDARRHLTVPILLMTYANPVLRYGASGFAAQARAAGVDGVIVSDLPPEEIPEAWREFDEAGLDTVMLVAPTTAPDRIPKLLARSRGFVYCLARTGVTGRSAGESGSLSGRVAELRRHTSLPVAVGFGISTVDDAAALRGVADAVIVGAAFMRAVSEDPARGAADRVLGLAGELVGALA